MLLSIFFLLRKNPTVEREGEGGKKGEGEKISAIGL